jgi:glutamine synthetase
MNDSADLSKFTIGAEIEFYLFAQNGALIADLDSGKFPTKRYKILPEYTDSLAAFRAEISAQYSFQDESGAGQFEVDFPPIDSAKQLAQTILEFKEFAMQTAEMHGFSLSFAAKPISHQPGNALHIHYCNDAFDPYGLAANAGVMDIRVASNNDYILWAIGGILAQTQENLSLFYSSVKDVARFEPWFNAPTKLCWGANNRSVALRIPDAKPKRIEHRIACADVAPLPLIEHIIAAAEYGMQNRINPPAQVFGNAWEVKYDFPAIFA